VADHPLGIAPHVAHDLELIARVAAGDGTEVDSGRARALLAACPECRALDADLRSIASSVRALAAQDAGVRAPRDFRLTPEVATRLRPAGLGIGGLLRDGIRTAFGSVRGRVGGGVVAIGLIGILFGSGLGASPSGFATTGAAPTTGPAPSAGGASTPGITDAKGPVTGAVSGPEASVRSDVADGAAPTAVPTAATAPAPAPSRVNSRSVAILTVSGLLVLAGLVLVLSTALGRRSGP
jgi:hypothetical protein